MIKNKKAAGWNQTAYKKSHQKFNRNLLPIPENYYNKQFPNLCIKPGWVKVACPFHDDRTPSLSVNLDHGGFKCWACDARGGDVIAFQMLRYNQSFKKAVTALNAWEVQK